MYFNNPEIIKTETDVILGGVRVGESDLNYLNLINKSIQIYAYHIRKDIEALVSDNISHAKALSLTAEKIYERLNMYQNIPPRDEEHLAELMMESKNFEMWSSDIKRRFFETHNEKVDVETKIPVSGDGGISQQEIEEIKGYTNLDLILEKLSMYMDIGNPTND